MSTMLKLEIAGTTLPLLETKSEAGNVYWTLRTEEMETGNSGVKIEALADEIPDSVKVEGVTIKLALDTSEQFMTDAAKVRVPVPADKRRISYNGTATGKVNDEVGRRTVSVRVSLTKDGGWNVTVKVTVPSATAATAKADALAALQALLTPAKSA